MAKLPTYRPAVGAPMDAAAINTLFTDTATATADIDAANVRSQGVDVAQVETFDGTTWENGRVTRFADEFKDSTNYTIPSGASTEVTRNTYLQFAIRPGDTVRIYTTLEVTDLVWDSRTITADARADSCLLVGLGWIFWLEWDVTSAALGAWVAVPGQDVFATHYANVVDNAGVAVPHMRSSKTQSSIIVPHVYYSADAGGGGETFNLTTGQWSQPIRRTRAYHHTSTSPGTQRVYGVRLMCRGAVSLGMDPAGTGGGLFMVRDTVLYAGDVGFPGQSIKVQSVAIVPIVQASS